MAPNRLARLAELRRALPLVAAALFLLALALPMWRITLTAPQYPGRALPVELYAYPRLGGEYAEVQLLNKYAGFHFPDPVFVEPNYAVHENAIAAPEWVLGPLVFVGVAVACVAVALAPSERTLERGLTAQLVGTLAVFGGMAAIIQYRLYQAGHSLDPNAPLKGVEGFTPPLLGPYAVANISGYAWLGPGGYLTVVAIALLAVAYLLRDSEATVGDLPALARSSLGRVGERVRRTGDDSRRERGRDRDRSRAATAGERRSGADARARATTDAGGDPP